MSCSIFWVHGDTVDHFIQDFSKIAALGNLPQSQPQSDEFLNSVRLWLEEQPNFLLIIDAVDDIGLFNVPRTDCESQNCRELLRFLPRGNTGTILWSSRDSSIVGSLVGYGQGIEVSGMSDAEAIDLLQKGSRDPRDSAELSTRQAQSHVIELLERMPLTISHAAAYMRRTGISLETYVTRLESKETKVKVLEKQLTGRYQHSDLTSGLLRTWVTSIDTISKENPLVDKIIHAAVLLNHQDIPHDFLVAVAGQADEDDIMEALTRIQDFAFLKVRATQRNQSQTTYDFHSLVQLAGLRALETSVNDAKRDICTDTAIRALADLFPDQSLLYYGSQKCAPCVLYFPHVISVLNSPWTAKHGQPLSQLLRKVSIYLHLHGRWRESEEIDLRLRRIFQDLYGSDDPETLRSTASLAETYQKRGELDKAEHLMAEVVDARTGMFGLNDTATIDCMESLAEIYTAQQRFDDARELLHRILALREVSQGVDHPRTLMTISMIAQNLQQANKILEALAMNFEVLKRCKSEACMSHEILFVAHHQYINLLYIEGTPDDEIERQLVDWVRAMIAVSGREDPHVLLGMDRLNIHYQLMGKLDKAEELQWEVYETQKKTLGVYHSRTLESMESLIQLLRKRDDSRVSTMLKELVDLSQTVLGEYHPTTLSRQQNLGLEFYHAGRWLEAKDAFLQLLERRRKALGEQHADTLTSMRLLAHACYEARELENAYQFAMEHYRLLIEHMGPEDTETLTSLVGLGLISRDRGSWEQAISFYRQAIAGMCKVYGCNHPKTIEIMRALAALYEFLGDVRACVKMWYRVWVLESEVHGPNHPVTVKTKLWLSANVDVVQALDLPWET